MLHLRHFWKRRSKTFQTISLEMFIYTESYTGSHKNTQHISIHNTKHTINTNIYFSTSIFFNTRHSFESACSAPFFWPVWRNVQISFRCFFLELLSDITLNTSYISTIIIVLGHSPVSFQISVRGPTIPKIFPKMFRTKMVHISVICFRCFGGVFFSWFLGVEKYL